MAVAVPSAKACLRVACTPCLGASPTLLSGLAPINICCGDTHPHLLWSPYPPSPPALSRGLLHTCSTPHPQPCTPLPPYPSLAATLKHVRIRVHLHQLCPGSRLLPLLLPPPLAPGSSRTSRYPHPLSHILSPADRCLPTPSLPRTCPNGPASTSATSRSCASWRPPTTRWSIRRNAWT